MKFTKVCLVCLVLAVAAYGGPLSIVQNGSFEIGTYADNSGGNDFMQLVAGAPNISGWSIIAGSPVTCPSPMAPGYSCAPAGIDWNRTYWSAADGLFSLDLNGLNPGGVEQMLATTPGQMYRVSFALAGNPDNTPWVKVMITDPTGGSPYTFNAQGNTHANMDWEYHTFDFTATGDQTLLQFTSDTTDGARYYTFGGNWYGSPWGPALDDVSVDPIPEPGSLLLLGSGLIGAAGFIRRKVRK